MHLEHDELLMAIDAVRAMRDRLVAEREAQPDTILKIMCTRAEMRHTQLLDKLETEREDRENGDA